MSDCEVAADDAGPLGTTTGTFSCVLWTILTLAAVDDGFAQTTRPVDCSVGETIAAADGIHLSGPAHALVHGNVIAGNKGRGVHVDKGSVAQISDNVSREMRAVEFISLKVRWLGSVFSFRHNHDSNPIRSDTTAVMESSSSAGPPRGLSVTASRRMTALALRLTGVLRRMSRRTQSAVTPETRSSLPGTPVQIYRASGRGRLMVPI